MKRISKTRNGINWVIRKDLYLHCRLFWLAKHKH